MTLMGLSISRICRIKVLFVRFCVLHKYLSIFNTEARKSLSKHFVGHKLIKVAHKDSRHRSTNASAEHIFTDFNAIQGILGSVASLSCQVAHSGAQTMISHFFGLLDSDEVNFTILLT